MRTLLGSAGQCVAAHGTRRGSCESAVAAMTPAAGAAAPAAAPVTTVVVGGEGCRTGDDDRPGRRGCRPRCDRCHPARRGRWRRARHVPHRHTGDTRGLTGLIWQARRNGDVPGRRREQQSADDSTEHQCPALRSPLLLHIIPIPPSPSDRVRIRSRPWLSRPLSPAGRRRSPPGDENVLISPSQETATSVKRTTLVRSSSRIAWEDSFGAWPTLARSLPHARHRHTTNAASEPNGDAELYLTSLPETQRGELVHGRCDRGVSGYAGASAGR